MTFRSLIFTFWALMCLSFLSACQPAGGNRLVEGAQSGTDTTDPAEILTDFGAETRNFFSYGGTKTYDTLSVPLTMEDTFVVGGPGVQTRLQSLNADSRACLVFAYKTYNPARILALSATRQRVVLSSASTGAVVTYQWIMAPNDSTKNQQDCLTTGMIDAKNQIYGAAAVLKFSLNDLCSDCTGAPISDGMAAFFTSGLAIDNVTVSSLKLRPQPGTVVTTGPSCSSSSSCMALSYDCCLEGQCVKDGGIRNGVDQTLAGFLAAQADVSATCSNFTRYPQYYYVCPEYVDPHCTSSTTTDPAFEALQRLNGMKDLWECLNPQWDEIGYCAIRFDDASTLISSATPADHIFSAGVDDDNFAWTGNLLPDSTIREIRYGEQLLYKNDVTGYDVAVVAGSHSILGLGNSDITTAQTVEVTKTLPTTIPDDTLVIKYKVDATCEKISSTLARCKKSYVQGQASTPPRPTDHATSAIFRLPTYADLSSSYPPNVSVGETPISSGSTTWNVSGTNIVFVAIPTANQVVDITYYVTTNVSDLTAGKTLAQTRVNSMCRASNDTTTNWNLRPLTASDGTTVVNYECTLPTASSTTIAAQRTFSLSGKSVPSRYFDVNGTAWDSNQGSAPAQEGIEFKYTGDALKPNNASTYIGFHEIYGSFNKETGAAKPPLMVPVKRNTTYDVYVNSGIFSTCVNCGSDPYQALLKLFPGTYSSHGGGYVPDVFASSRLSTTGTYRADDLLFGRACFVPATMLPWSHAAATTVQTQRQRRMAAQHFLFSNGYDRDWYGFDYGSVIGSFDGVTWFSIGNQRRFKANSSKLYLAVNGYFGDQTLDNPFKVTVVEALNVANSGSDVTNDTLSDGAECQKNHFCSTDDDCLRQLGYDYTCQNVTSITTPWPIFDGSGNETPGSQTVSLATLIGGTNGQIKRCVYRGRGAPCEADLTTLGSSSYNGSSAAGLSACSPNNYCADLSTSRFNTSITRYAASPTTQNALGTTGTRDVFGLGARIMGRPMDFYATKSPASVTSTSWGLSGTLTLASYLQNSANVAAVCVPGRSYPTAAGATYNDPQDAIPSTADKEAADRMFGVGATAKLTSTTTTSANLLAMCPATESGTYIHQSPTRLFTDSAVSVAQNVPSSLLDLTDFSSLSIFNTNAGSAATSLGWQRHACMRAAGAPCFSDLECAPSAPLANKMKTLASWGGFASNSAEQAFWQEDLVCGNPEPKLLFDTGSVNTSYDLKNNKCCRENNKTIKVLTQFDNDSSFINCYGTQPAIAGINIAYNSASRNTRNHTTADKVTCVDPLVSAVQAYPALKAPTPRAPADTLMDINHILNQYKTLDLNNSRTCCTGHWVRSFASANGGGHKWGSGKLQTLDKSIFYAWDWMPDQSMTTTLDEAENLACSAENVNTLACEIRSLTDSQMNKYLKWIDRFELVGIPQVLIPDPKSALVEKIVDGNQADLQGTGQPLDDTLLPIIYTGARPDLADVQGATQYYVSAASYDKMAISTGKIKKVFSESEFNCCVPAGGTIPSGASSNTCCTGTLTNDNGPTRCCLGDYADVTVYLNRYVSSEGRGLADSMYDQETGYINDPAQVSALANSRNLCCSGKTATGVAVSDLYIPLQSGGVNPLMKTKRFLYRSDAVDNNNETGAIGGQYDAGLRWNNHIYCAP